MRYVLDTLPREKQSKPVTRKLARVLLPPKGTTEIKSEIYTLQELAAELEIGPYIFHRLLREMGIIREDNLPTNSYFREGLLIVEKVPYAFKNGCIGFLPKTRVTRKGMAYFKKMFKEMAA
jgi:phage antirepressor YoqD-like protein